MGSTPPNRADFSASRRGSNIAPDSGHDFVDKRLEVTPSQIQELVETNKALREMVIAVTALLSDPSRGAQYQSECRLPTERPALNYKELNDYRYEDVELMTPKELEKDTQGRIRKYKGAFLGDTGENLGPVTIRSVPHWFHKLSEDSGMRGKPGVPSSSVDSELLDKHRLALFDALFGWEVVHGVGIVRYSEDLGRDRLHSGKEEYPLHRESFEFSRSTRLCAILDWLAQKELFGKFSAAPLTTETWLLLIISVGQWIQHFLKQFSESAKVMETMSADNVYSLDHLRRFCYRRRILVQPKPQQPVTQRMHTRLLAGLLFFLMGYSEHQVYIPLRQRQDRWDKIFAEHDRDEITQLFAHLDEVPDIDAETLKVLRTKQGPVFAPGDFGIRSLVCVGRLQVRFTEDLADHLKLNEHHTILTIFCHPSWLDSAPCEMRRHLDNNIGPTGISNLQQQELKWTYALLFAPYESKTGLKNAKKLRKLRTSGVPFADDEKDYRFDTGSEDQSLSEKFIDPRKEPAKSAITESMRHVILPSCMYILFDASGKDSNVGMDKLISLGPPYLLDFKIILGAIYDYGANRNNSYNSFEVYGDRLRQLKEHLDGNKPKGIRQLWGDGRDSFQWWTLWGVLLFGCFTLFFAIASFATSIAQTVAGFRAIGNR